MQLERSLADHLLRLAATIEPTVGADGNPAHWLAGQARRRPDAPAVLDGVDVHDTWAELSSRVASVAGALRHEVGLVTGERVAVVMRNRPEFLEALFAIWHAGLVAVPMHAPSDAAAIAAILQECDAAAVITDDDHVDDVACAVGSVRSLREAVVVPSTQWDRWTRFTPVEIVERDPDDAAWLFYGSGTTGRPKGATLTHRDLMAMALTRDADIGTISADLFRHAALLLHG